MPRAAWAGDAVYAAAERFIDECLRTDGSLFMPGRPIWVEPTVEDLYARFVVNEQVAGANFLERLERQLEGSPDAAIQLAAEILFFNYLCEDNTSAKHKRATVERVLGWMSAPASAPAELDAAYPGGLARIGLATTQKWRRLAFLLEFIRAWKRLSAAERDDLLQDRTAFRSYVHAVPKHSASFQVEALLHLVFPEPFEPIVSPNAKRRIVEAFSEHLDGTEEDIDEQLATIRARIAAEYGAGFSFYDPDVEAVWSSATGGDLRAWLVRGAKAYGRNLIPRWLAEGFVSISKDTDGYVPPGLSRDEIMAIFAQHLPELRREQLHHAALTTARFVDRIQVGDLVLTISPGDEVFVGRVTGELEWVEGDEPGTARRRRVEWLNHESPATRSDLPDRVRRLLRPNTVIDLSAVAEDVAALIPASDNGAWSEFLHWSRRIYETEGFDEEERDYKLEIGERLREARAALARGDPQWLALLRRAFGPPNNLTSWRAHGEFLAALEADPERASRFLTDLWDAELTEEGLTAIFNSWPAENSPGDRVSLASFLRMALDPTDAPAFRARPVRRAHGLLQLAEPPIESPTARYLGFIDLLDELRTRLAHQGVELRDRLDAQGVLWWVAGSGPPDTWSEAEQQAFLRWRGDLTGDGGEVVEIGDHRTGRVAIEPVAKTLADTLFIGSRWLDEIVSLLNEKRQVVFYGPPGTGKTYVAQALAKHAVAGGGHWELVQFHPAYSYEDFFEGYRPTTDGDGAVSYVLRRGPLRRLAAAAREDAEHPYVLVIDEINRGNLAKIFGELYFLLEYRDRPVRLQYSPQEEFELPDNLFVIGTMNTADRSIALVDSALRRRFYFVPFLPTQTPIGGVLERWLEDNGYEPEPARLLDALNEALSSLPGAAEEFAIGPSYFMTRDGPPKLERIWRYAIMPLLVERFYGAKSEDDLDAEFGLDALRARLWKQGDEADVEAESEQVGEPGDAG